MAVLRTREGHIAIVVTDRPEAHNAMNMKTTEQLAAIYDELPEDDET